MVKIKRISGGNFDFEEDPNNAPKITAEDKNKIEQGYREADEIRAKMETKLKETAKLNSCIFYDCSKQEKLISCPYCRHLFCSDHITPKPTIAAPFDYKVPVDIIEQWRNPNAHPCGNYTSRVKEADRLGKIRGWANYPSPQKWNKKMKLQYDTSERIIKKSYNPVKNELDIDNENFRKTYEETKRNEKIWKNEDNLSPNFKDYEKYLIIIAIVGSLIIIVLGALGIIN